MCPESADRVGALYASEFSAAALNARGAALLRADRLDEAEHAFRRSLSTHQEQARGHLGLVVVAQRRLLDRFLTEMPPRAAGWNIPIDPLFKQLTGVADFAHALRRLANRAE